MLWLDDDAEKEYAYMLKHKIKPLDQYTPLHKKVVRSIALKKKKIKPVSVKKNKDGSLRKSRSIKKNWLYGLRPSDIIGLKEIVNPFKKLRPVVVPEGVSCKFRSYQIEVIGPLGTIYLDTVMLRREHVAGKMNRLIPTFQKLLENAILGVYYGFILKLKVRGSGFKVIRCRGRTLTLRVGYSHQCNLTIPPEISAVCTKYNQILCHGTIKSRLTKFAEHVKRIKKRDAYRAKGIFQVGEALPNKTPGKAGRKG
jgi:large subunit ribosomal protein L6